MMEVRQDSDCLDAENKKLSFSHVLDITTSLYEGAMFNRIKSLLGNGDSKMGRTNTCLKD